MHSHFTLSGNETLKAEHQKANLHCVSNKVAERVGINVHINCKVYYNFCSPINCALWASMQYFVAQDSRADGWREGRNE
jgi:hypothetical protein